MHQNRSGSNNAVKTGTVVTHLLADDGKIPNHPTLPLLVYQGALDLPENDPAATIEAVFASNSWSGSWRNGVYKYHHYHSTAHEVLGVYSGTAQVQFGGEKGVILSVKRGDVVVIPAGVGHKNVGQSHDFRVVGAYPHGQHADLNGEDLNVRPQVDENIARVPLPELDPVYGAESPLIEHWGKS